MQLKTGGVTWLPWQPSLFTLDNADRIAQDLTDAGLVDGRNKVLGKEQSIALTMKGLRE